MMDISVMIPAYNAEKTLERQLRSLAIQQSNFRWEVLVVDNGSSDSTADIVNNLSASFPVPLRLIHASEQRGAAYARNRGAASSQAAVLAFCDADDQVESGWLAALWQSISHGADVVGGPILVSGPGAEGEATQNSDHSGVMTTTWGKSVSSCNMAVRHSVFDASGGFNTSLASYGLEDSELCIRLSLNGAKFIEASGMAVRFSPTHSLRSLVSKNFRSGRSEVRVWQQHPSIFGNRYRWHRVCTDTVRAVAANLLSKPPRARTAVSQLVIGLGRLVESIQRQIQGWQQPEYRGMAQPEGPAFPPAETH